MDLLYKQLVNKIHMFESEIDNTCPVPKGILFIVGGKEDKEPEVEEGEDSEDHQVLKTFISLTGKENPVIEVITSASTEAGEMFDDYKLIFEKLGVTNVQHIHHNNRDEVMKDTMEERLRKADGFFLSGGDQLLLTSMYGGSKFLTIMKERYISDPIVIGGTSAGAMAMSTPMIYAGNKSVQQVAGEIKITTGLEFVKDVCIDTHFIDRSRFVRMAQVVSTNPTCLGIGIEEDTAIILRNGSKATIVGSGIVTVIEGFFITNSNVHEFSEKKTLSIRDLKVHLLSKDDEYDIPQTNPAHQ